MENTNFLWANKSIFGKLRPRNLRACIRIHAYTRACPQAVYAYTGLRMHVRVLETMKDKFFSIKYEVWNESHIVWKPFQTPIFNYIKPYMVVFQNIQKILRENIRFTRNSESKREFFHKTSSSQYFLIGAFFWPWSLSFKITNHFFIWLWIDLIERNGQNQT